VVHTTRCTLKILLETPLEPKTYLHLFSGTDALLLSAFAL